MFEKTKVSGYKQIFNARGENYHHAMQAQPNVRRAEFETAVQLAEIQTRHVVGDVPAGGGYLRAFIPSETRLVAIETSSVFLRQNQKIPDGDSQILCDDLGAIPLENHALDRVLSIAGAHHLSDHGAFYREVFRLLAPGGIFVLADVQAGSTVARFLNEWVHAHNSQGHCGVFLNENVARELISCGFEMRRAETRKYAWQFDSTCAMIEYCRGLFGIDMADDMQILQALQTVLGVQKIGERVQLQWELLFVVAIKPAV